MALPLIEATGIQPGMRVLEVGAGSGHIAATLASHWQVQVIALEPWTDGSAIQQVAQASGVGNAVLPLRLKAQALPFPDSSFDAIISIGAFEMIGDERPQALQEIIRLLRPGARFGIAEPMCQAIPMPDDLAKLDEEHNLQFRTSFRTPEWNQQLFAEHGLKVTEVRHFEQAYTWWLAYSAAAKLNQAEVELIQRDQGRWLSLGMVVGQKQA